ncbi:MAG: hypothetical protein GY869_04255, partial [Planctomycetes bacterium]|nr:hypothetical protein [Planctomycetota bacterium]
MSHTNFKQILLTVTAPDGQLVQKSFNEHNEPLFTISDFKGLEPGDGLYTYQLTLFPTHGDKNGEDAVIQSGYFRINLGRVEIPKPAPEKNNPELAKPQEYFNEDLYVRGKIAVGSDVTDGITTALTTIRLYENNCRILFDDSSTMTGFADNDWCLIANDSTNGGAEYFAIQDKTASAVPFKIMAGAPTNSIYVDAQGELGLGTATPSANLHFVDSGSAYFKMERTGAS